ncbi:hypothetical protein [Catenulispora rubra]|uniref:hypothetical protein n=1 Tax=Catenulispora rubra TaxID=280293 RepID=UPI0018925D2F|nr:hypothetical protein [Catenulispora rubra]
MTRNRRVLCGHNADEPMYPFYPEHAYRPADAASLDMALKDLSEVLNGGPDPLETAVAHLSAGDVAGLMQRAPAEVRNHAMRSLGVPSQAPRTIGQALSRDMLARLHQVHLHDAQHAGLILTEPLLGALRAATILWAGGVDTAEEVELATSKTAGWSDAVLHLTLWSAMGVSVADARLIAWASTQPWWADLLSSGEEGAKILAAAHAVMAASSDFTFTNHGAGDKASPADEPEAQLSAADTDEETGSTSGTNNEPEPVEPAHVAASLSEVLAAVRIDRQHLADRQRDATDATARITAAIQAGQIPGSEDLQAVSAYSTSWGAVVSALSAAPGAADRLGDLTPGDLAALDAAIAELERLSAAGQRSQRLAKLAELVLAAPNPALEEHLHALASAVPEAVAAGLESPLVQSFLALADLVDLMAAGLANADPLQAGALLARAGTGLPPHLTPLLFAVGTGQIIRAQVDTSALEMPEQLPDPELREPVEEHTVAVSPDAAIWTGAIISDVDADGSRGGEATAADVVQEQAAVPSPTVVTGSAAIIGTVAQLIGEQRFGMAAAIAERAGWSAGRVTSLRFAALAEAIRGDSGPSASRLRRDLEESGSSEDLAAETCTLLLAVPALLRAALVTGAPATGALLIALAPRLEDNLGQVCEQIGRRALRGALTGNALRTVLADVTELEAHLEMSRRNARDRMRPTTLRFKRATDIAQRWLAGDGLLGSMLKAAAKDDRSRLEEVQAAVFALSGQDAVARAIDDLDGYFKGRSGKPIEGAARQDLFLLAAESCALVSAWLDAVAAFTAATSDNAAWATAELTEMRSTALGHSRAALAGLEEHAGRGDALAAAAASAARVSLTRTFELLDGSESLPLGEPLPDAVLTGELLKVPGAVVEQSSGLVTVPAQSTARDLVEAALQSWPSAFATKIAGEEYTSARYMLDDLSGGAPEGGGGLGAEHRQQLGEAEQRSRTELSAVRDRLLAERGRARLRNEISEEQDGEISGMLSAADPERRADLGVVRDQLSVVDDLLPRYREEAAQRLNAQLLALPGSADRAEEVERIRQLIATGELSTAEELLYFMEIGEDVPNPAASGWLAAFFPAVPDALPAGVGARVISAARAGGTLADCPQIGFEKLSAAARGDVAEALEAWRTIGATPAETRSTLDVKAHLLPALRLAGFEFKPGSNVKYLNVLKGRDRRVVEVTGVSWNGRPLVPQFGSKLGGRLRVLLCWGQPNENLVMSWADQDTSGEAILVAHFGTMTADTRRRLAARAVRTDAPVAVLDDAALVYLAAHGGRQLDAAMAVLLPFTAVQPYVRNKRWVVAPEMFFGRDAERKAVLSPEGTQVIFGGRGLGKSALLREAKAVFEREPGRVAIHIELTTAEIGPTHQKADAVWDVLLRDLEAADVIPAVKGGGRNGKRNHEIVRAGVRDWLAADSGNRLLILLDESDGFFETDAPRFLETNRLKDLGQLSGVEGHAKVVFAGLHSVQRFAKMSNNTFKHLAQRPTVIGPLRPQFAYNLISEPMQALGYEFDDPDLVNRILGYCSYQPFLLQMFGNRLVEHMHARRAAGFLPGEPPFAVTRADVEAVEGNPDLRADITSTFSDTLNLDARYNVIANVLAHHAHEHGMDFRLTDVQLREECRSYWPRDFDGMDVEAFRAYLQEMVGLGVLAPNNDGTGWHLRSPNVLRMIGTKDRVMAELVDAEHAVPSDFIAMSSRRMLDDGAAAPLTAEQLTDVLGDHTNQVRLVLGSQATGVHRVGQNLREVCEDLAGRYVLVETPRRRQFEDALVNGRPGQRRVVLSDLLTVEVKESSCVAALHSALERRPDTPGVTRSVVIVSGAAQIGFWLEALAAGRQSGFGVVSLRRFDRRTLHVWSLESSRFQTEERQRRLLAVTSGWPMLVEQAVELAVSQGSEDAALTELERVLAGAVGAADLVDAVGLTVDELISVAFAHVIEFAAVGASLADLTAAAELSGHPDPDAAVAALSALGVFDVDGSGAHSVDPLLLRSWTHRRATGYGEGR